MDDDFVWAVKPGWPKPSLAERWNWLAKEVAKSSRPYCSEVDLMLGLTEVGKNGKNGWILTDGTEYIVVYSNNGRLNGTDEFGLTVMAYAVEKEVKVVYRHSRADRDLGIN